MSPELEPAVMRQLEESLSAALNDTLQAAPSESSAKTLRAIATHLEKQAAALRQQEIGRGSAHVLDPAPISSRPTFGRGASVVSDNEAKMAIRMQHMATDLAKALESSAGKDRHSQSLSMAYRYAIEQRDMAEVQQTLHNDARVGLAPSLQGRS